MARTVTAVIAEFNPFHEGHKWILDKARELTQADFVMVIMSPDFVQRGCPAIDDKYTRTRRALFGGADCVIELPVSFATGAARTFAKSAVTLLSSLGVIDYLCFGSESGDIETLKLLSDALCHETPKFSAAVKDGMKNGLSYPRAIDEGLKTVFSDRPEIIETYSSPNNRLGIEYLKAIDEISADKNTFSKHMLPVTAARTLPSSATASRAERFENGLPGMCSDDFYQVLISRLLGKTPEELTIYEDVSMDLASRIFQEARNATSFDELSEKIKTKAFTRTRIDRALIHIMLGITSEDVKRASESGYASYVRVLGFKKAFEPVIKDITEAGTCQLIMKQSQAASLSEDDLKLYKVNENASELYRLIRGIKYPNYEYIEASGNVITRKEADTPEGSRGIIVIQ